MVDLHSVGKNVGSLVLVAVRSFLLTMFVMLLLGVVLAMGSYFLLAQVQPVYGVIAAVVAFLECAAVGVILAGKRAFIMALVHGLRAQQLGRFGVRLLFERLLGISAELPVGERGGVVTRAMERLPLAQAEIRLNQVVSDLLNAQPAGGGVTGWVRRRLQAKLLAAVQKYTLARFREEGVHQGGVDLCKLQTDLEARIDDQLTAKLKHGVNVWMALVLVALPVQILAVVYLVIALLK